MKKITLIAAAFAFASLAHAQGTFPLNNVPIGKGPGKTGFTAVAPGADGTCLVVSGGVPTFTTCIVGQALTRTNDTNVTLTLGGAPNTALVNAASLTLGWAGSLAVSRGGSGATTQQGLQNAAHNCPPTRAGDLIYYDGANWVCLAGNNSGTRILQQTSAGVPSWVIAGTGTVTSVTLGAGYGIAVTGTNPITGSGTVTPAVQLTTASNFLGADVAMSATNTYFDGPSMAQGTTGTWFVSGSVSLLDAAVTSYDCKLWDGTTVISSGRVSGSSGGAAYALALGGVLASPAANIRISCKSTASNTGNIKFNQSGNSKDSGVSGFRIQ